MIKTLSFRSQTDLPHRLYEANIIFVLNEVTAGVIPLDAESHRYVDRSGIVGQHLARMCDEVYEVKLGLKRRLK